MLEEKEEYHSESNRVKLLIELIRALEKVKNNDFCMKTIVNLPSFFICSRTISL